MGGRWVSIDSLLEDLDSDPNDDQIAQRHIEGERRLAEEREARGVPLSDDD